MGACPVVLISGASKGVGKAMAQYFASQQYNIILIARTEDKLKTLADKLKLEHKVKVSYFAIDVADFALVAEAAKTIIATYNRIDVLINSAGIVNFGTSNIEPEEFQRMLDVNVNSMYNWTYHIAPIMKQQQRGYIFNISSRAAILPNPATGAYALTKASMVAYSHALMRELKDYNIKVTALCPGTIDTELTADRDMDPDKKLHVDDMVKLVACCLSLSKNAFVPDILIDDTTSPYIEVKSHQRKQ